MEVKKMKCNLKVWLLVLSLWFVAPCIYAIPAGQQSVPLQQTVKQQQVMLEHQSAQIKILTMRVDRLTRLLSSKQAIRYKLTPTLVHPYIHVITIHPSYESILEQATDNSGSQPVIVIGNDKAQLSFLGKISPMVFTASDGKGANTFFATNDAAKSDLSVNTLFHPSTNWSIGSNVELDFDVNVSNLVSQTIPIPAQSVYVDKAEIYVHSAQLGELSLGVGKTASADTAYSDFSGTALVARATAADIGGGLFYRNKATGTLSNVTVGDAVNGLDGLPGSMRVRYDTPSFSGFSLAASAIEGDEQDVALKFGHKFGAVKFATQVAYTTTQNVNTNTAVVPVQGDEVNGSAAVLFPVGVSFSGAYGELLVSQTGRKDPRYLYIKPGYQTDIFNVGLTAMTVDMGRYDNFAQNSDSATACGVQLLQNFNAWNLMTYMSYRNFSLHRRGSAFDNLNLFVVGALYKF